jgi:hypothetical protein
VRGRDTPPAAFRRRDRIKAGQAFAIERVGRGKYRLEGSTRRPNEGVVDWLLACPEKGFFVPVQSASTDTL